MPALQPLIVASTRLGSHQALLHAVESAPTCGPDFALQLLHQLLCGRTLHADVEAELVRPLLALALHSSRGQVTPVRMLQMSLP